MVPLVRTNQGTWTPLTASCYFWAEGDAIADADIAARGTGSIARDLGTRPIGDLKGILDNTPPEPVAVKHANLTPEGRWRAVVAERDERDRGREGRD